MMSKQLRTWIIEKLKSIGWTYEEKLWCDGSVMTYIFKLQDANNKESYWEVSIEDHHGDIDADDWIIYSSYHDPEQKDWAGNQIDTHGAVDYKVMKLFVMFVDTLEEEKLCD